MSNCDGKEVCEAIVAEREGEEGPRKRCRRNVVPVGGLSRGSVAVQADTDGDGVGRLKRADVNEACDAGRIVGVEGRESEGVGCL